MYKESELWVGLVISVLVFVAYWFVPKLERHRVGLLTFASFYWLIVISPRTFVVPFLGAVITFYIARTLRKNPSAWYLVVALAIPLLNLLSYQYLRPIAVDYGFFERYIVPLGLSYYTFKQMHFLIESQRGKFQELKFGEYLLYLIYFPMFIAGPIERVGSFQEAIKTNKFEQDMFLQGVERIIIGLFKKLIVADLLLASMLPNDLTMEALLEMPLATMMFVAVVKFLYVYMDFSGYVDMALGVSLLFGIRLMENFNNPLSKSNLAEFWRSWHISLSSWARDYVYFPVLGRFRIPSLALILTMLTIGAWHSLAPGWLLWGLHHGVGLSLLARYQQKIRPYKRFNAFRKTLAFRIAGIAAVWYYISIGHLLTFFPDSITQSLSLYLKAISFGWVVL